MNENGEQIDDVNALVEYAECYLDINGKAKEGG